MEYPMRNKEVNKKNEDATMAIASYPERKVKKDLEELY